MDPVSAALPQDLRRIFVATLIEDVNEEMKDDIEMPDNGNNQIALDESKLEEMTQISCKIDNKVVCHVCQVVYGPQKQIQNYSRRLHGKQLNI